MTLNSKLKTLIIDGPISPAAGSGGPVALRPPSGRNYRVIDAWGWHDAPQAGGVDITWAYYQYSGPNIAKRKDITALVAQNIRVPITEMVADGPSTIIGDLILRRNVYAALTCLSVVLNAGYRLRIRALVEEFDGSDD